MAQSPPFFLLSNTVWRLAVCTGSQSDLEGGIKGVLGLECNKANSCTHNVPRIFLILHEGIVQPDKLLVLTYNRKLILFKVGESGLGKGRKEKCIKHKH